MKTKPLVSLQESLQYPFGQLNLTIHRIKVKNLSFPTLSCTHLPVFEFHPLSCLMV